MKISSIARSTAILLLPMSVLAPHAHAGNCNNLSYAVDSAHTKLKQAANETNLKIAKNFAMSAKVALDDAASSATNCKCESAFNAFDNAASRADSAHNANDNEEFAETLNHTVRSFYSALDALRTCPHSR